VILHCSQKLAAKLADISPVPLEETSPLGSWHGHLFTIGRRQCVMFCHDATRYVLFLPALRKAQFAALGNPWFRELFTASLAVLGCPDAQIRNAELAFGPVRYDSATDRSVMGSINVAQQDLWAWLRDVPNVMDADPLAAAHWLNHRPTSARGKSLWPDWAMLEQLAAL
jgi:hypothetical protein